ncbi:tetratricopeptide repeat protein [Thalassotalea sediminis]|uniref:tetratricopeptide repeat protein n=1 Tax=Thalassotalea sediminis TaxID=1759089 RepID=UPI002573D7B1|nr:tetratricopeptide repeat protein [Thalassotalea sediminis]
MKKIMSLTAFIALTCATNFNAVSADLDLGIYELNRGEFKRAIEEFEPLVTEGYAPAQYQMALIYQNGWGAPKSKTKAFELMTMAAEQNFSDALFSLSVMYSEGEVVEKDLKKAFQLMEKAAKKGMASAQFNVGVMYANGEGTHRDYYKAARWYEKSARQNYALAQFNLAGLYFEGNGVEKSLEQSYLWNYIASKSGYVPAQKSRDMDEHKLSVKQIQDTREQAEALYTNLLEQQELKVKTRAASENLFK